MQIEKFIIRFMEIALNKISGDEITIWKIMGFAGLDHECFRSLSEFQTPNTTKHSYGRFFLVPNLESKRHYNIRVSMFDVREDMEKERTVHIVE